jgi:hypothetical protein
VIVKRKALSGDPRGYVSVDLENLSSLTGIDSDYNKFYGADYDRKETMSFHNKSHHTYVVSRTALESDVVINLPKLKTHMKAGISISLKNMIGVIGEKNSMVHYRIGSPSKRGDEFPENTSKPRAALLRLNHMYSDLFLSRGTGTSMPRMLVRIGGGKSALGSESEESTFLHSGNWCGNDTIWRTILDINKIMMYSDKDGKMHDLPQRKVLILVDGVLAGEGQGPLAPQTKKCGAIICGTDPWSVDHVGARLMGFDYQKIPLLYRAGKSPSDVKVPLSEGNETFISSLESLPNLHFKPPKTWNICL